MTQISRLAFIAAKPEFPVVMTSRWASGKPQIQIPPHILGQGSQAKEKMPPSFSSRVKEDSPTGQERQQWWPATPTPAGNDRWDKKDKDATVDDLGEDVSQDPGIFDDL